MVQHTNQWEELSDQRRIFPCYSSIGRYNNEWMIVDYKKFVPGKAIQPGTLTVLEEIP